MGQSVQTKKRKVRNLAHTLQFLLYLTLDWLNKMLTSNDVVDGWCFWLVQE